MLNMRIILAVTIFALLASFAYAESQQAQQKSSDHKNAPTADKRGTDDKPLVIKVLPSDEAERTAKENQEEKNAKRKTDEDLAKYTGELATYTKILVGVGAVQCAIFIAQLIAFVWQGRQLKRTVSLGREEFLSTHRPKIILRDAFCRDNETDRPIVVTYTIVNIGETRARIVMLGAEIRLRTHGTFSPDQSPTMNEGWREDSIGPLLEPGEERQVQCYTNRHWRTDDESRDHFIEDLMGVFFCGHLVYEDDRGVRRHTAFWRKYDLTTSRFYIVNHPTLKALEYAD